QAVAKRVEQPAFPGKELERAGDGPDLPDELVALRARRLVVRARGRLQLDAIAASDYPQWNQDIVENRISRDGLEEPAADGVNSPGRTDGRTRATFTPPNERLIAPIEGGAPPEGGTVAGWGQRQLAADRTDAWFAEIPDERPNGARLEALPRVRQH